MIILRFYYTVLIVLFLFQTPCSYTNQDLKAQTSSMNTKKKTFLSGATLSFCWSGGLSASNLQQEDLKKK